MIDEAELDAAEEQLKAMAWGRDRRQQSREFGTFRMSEE